MEEAALESDSPRVSAEASWIMMEVLLRMTVNTAWSSPHPGRVASPSRATILLDFLKACMMSAGRYVFQTSHKCLIWLF